MSDFEECKKVLKKITEDNGREILLDDGAFFSAFEKEAPDLVREKKRLKLAFSEGIAQELYDHRKQVSVPDPMVISRCANSLEDSYGIAAGDAADTVNLIWYALSGQDELQKQKDERDCAKNIILALRKAQEGERDGIFAFADRGKLFTKDDIWNSYFEIIRLANQGNTYAMLMLADEYHNGRFLKKNDELALVWIKKAIKGGNTAASYSLGECYYYGMGTNKDINIAKGYFLGTLQKGYVGNLYPFNDYMLSEKDFEEIIKMRKQAALESPSPLIRTFSCLMLGQLYGKNLNNEKEGLYWFELGAKSEEPEALWQFALYRSTLSNARSEIDSILEMFEKGAHCPDNYLSLIYMYSDRGSHVIFSGLEDDFIPKNAEKHKYWLDKLLDGISLVEITAQTTVYFKGLPNSDKVAYADRLMEEHKILPYVAGCVCLENADGDEKTIQNGIAYLEEAAKDRDPDACYKLGELYHDGKAVAKSEAMEAVYFEKAYRYYDKNPEKSHLPSTKLIIYKATAAEKMWNIFNDRKNSDPSYGELEDYWMKNMNCGE